MLSVHLSVMARDSRTTDRQTDRRGSQIAYTFIGSVWSVCLFGAGLSGASTGSMGLDSDRLSIECVIVDGTHIQTLNALHAATN